MQRSFHALLKTCETKGLLSYTEIHSDLHGKFRLTNCNYLRSNLAKTLELTILHLTGEPWELHHFTSGWDLGFHPVFRGRQCCIPTDTTAPRRLCSCAWLMGCRRSIWESGCAGWKQIWTHTAVLRAKWKCWSHHPWILETCRHGPERHGLEVTGQCWLHDVRSSSCNLRPITVLRFRHPNSAAD